jgi:type I restriction enzyme S subunit
VLQRGYDLPVQQRRAGNVPVFAANGTVGAHCEAKVAAPGVVTGRSGSIGKVHFVASDFWPLNTALYVRDFRGNDPEWVAELLRWMHLERFARGGAVPTLNRNLVHGEIVPRPPLDEQRRIVGRIKECMERVDEIERLRAEALAEAEAALPSRLSEIFDQLGAQYGSTTIGDVATETRYGTSQKCDERAEGVPILRIPNVAAGVINYGDLKYCPLDRSELERIRLVDGDLLFVRTNGSRDLVGRCAVYRPRARTTSLVSHPI